MTVTEWAGALQGLLGVRDLECPDGCVVLLTDDAVFLVDMETVEEIGIDLSCCEDGEPGIYARVSYDSAFVADKSIIDGWAEDEG